LRKNIYSDYKGGLLPAFFIVLSGWKRQYAYHPYISFTNN